MHRELVANRDKLQTASPVSNADFLAAIAKVRKSVGDRDLQKYADWATEFGAA